MIFAVSCHLVIIAQVSLAHNPGNFVTIAKWSPVIAYPLALASISRNRKMRALNIAIQRIKTSKMDQLSTSAGTDGRVSERFV